MNDVPDFGLRDKVAVITGSTRGIGLGIARAMGVAGAKIVVSSESGDDTALAAETLRSEGINALGVACDIRDSAAQRALVERATSECGGLDILVCNAGITGAPGPFASMSMANFDQVLAVNLRSMVELTTLALPHMTRPGSAVILVSSISGLRGNGAINAYALAKAGVAQLARNLAVEWGPRGVRVNALSPGLIRTELSRPLMENAQFMARRMQMTPLRRPGEIAEVAGAAVFLACSAGGFVTGHNLVVDGGTVITDGS
jgi:NAD(P)-dependent dehydrogenase (short-subunit alcohol dehydrogenase family)